MMNSRNVQSKFRQAKCKVQKEVFSAEVSLQHNDSHRKYSSKRQNGTPAVSKNETREKQTEY